MTECIYVSRLETFANDHIPTSVTTVPVLTQGRQALVDINTKLGLGFDPWDVDFYTRMFTDTLKRNPTDVECFDLGQSNSEHSR